MIRLEDLDIENLKVYQDDELYTFTSDAILLSKFARTKKGDVVADFCSGSGVVGFNLYGQNKKDVKELVFFEMQKSMFDLSVKSIEENGLKGKFYAVNTKVQDIPSEYNEKFSLIVCNPPYMPKNSGETKANKCVAIARSEVELSLEELIKAISKCLKFGGRTCIVHRAERLSEIAVEMKKNNIEMKRLQTVSAKGKDPYLVLVEGVKGGKAGLKIMSNAIN